MSAGGGRLYRVRLHPDVRGDLLQIADWIAERAGEARAVAILDEIGAKIRALETLPQRGSLRDEIAPGLRAIPVARRGVLVFTIDEAQAEVLVHAVSWGGADWIGAVGRRGG
ncbi:type II toxin-antitoxin system RelE/ParE family toxin [Tropicimonas sp. IMCC34043]|uniref:type II toxin-antitoxin system RelE/ParE family toxin n=1 Tax=Tropicimonas sp. IMCC34043 TaxID=2248760 RepID=UPI000E239206|nr:type II toxin-antitoxin system RelE/ParE family toxin [Tropicimonas sp. IMCC34043]